MSRPLRGRRYLHNDNLLTAETIIKKLPYWDYQETAAWYEQALEHPKFDDRSKALLACNDRYFLLTHLCKRHDALHPWIFDRCREVEEAPNGFLDLWARYHYKSSLITFAGIVQEVLTDPELTVAIFSHTQPIAQAFLDQIKREFEDNDDLKQIFSDVLWTNPRADAPKWSADGIIVRRNSNPKEATVEAHGLVDGQPTSRHYGLLVYDDIVTEKAVTNDLQIRKTTLAWEQSDNLSKADGVRKWAAGTRWHFGDTYGIILERHALKKRIYPATDDGTLKGKPVFLTRERWEDVKRNQRSTCAAQMLLNPVAGSDAVFQTEWFRGFEMFPSVLNVYILCDPSKGKRRIGRGAGSDRTAIVVIGIDPAGNKYLLDGYRHRMKMSERWNYLKALYDKWAKHPGVQFVRVGYEQYGAQVDVEVIQEYQQRDKVFFEVEELGFPREGMHSKKDRVERLEPDMRTGRFYLPGVVWHPDVPGAIESRCLWSVWSQKDVDRMNKINIKSEYNIGQIVYRPLRGDTKAMKYLKETQQPHRMVLPIKRIDEENEIYDVTRAFMEEARSFPFAPHDDLIDATARIYDMEPQIPVQYDPADITGLDEDLLSGETYVDA